MSWIKLANQHLVIDNETAATFFPAASHVSVVYYPNTKTLLLADVNDALFKSLHKTVMLMVKDKNMKGDKAITLEEIIIDNDINPADRELQHKADEAMKIISIIL
jgi:hypothetical protein